MNILAAFFVFGLLLTGLRILIKHLWVSLMPFNHTESFLIHSQAAEYSNLLSAASNGTLRRNSDLIRITSTRESNDRMKRLVVRRAHNHPDLEIARVTSVA